MRALLLLAVLVVGIGCNSSTSEESSAAQQLAPKPLTEAQKAQLDKFKTQGGTPSAPGH